MSKRIEHRKFDSMVTINTAPDDQSAAAQGKILDRLGALILLIPEQARTGAMVEKAFDLAGKAFEPGAVTIAHSKFTCQSPTMTAMTIGGRNKKRRVRRATRTGA